MLFRQLFDNVSSTYTYLLADQRTREAVLIDPVFEHHRRDYALLTELNLTLKYTLDTHAHADHVTGAWLMKDAVGSQIVLSKRYNAEGVDLPVDHGDTLKFGDYAVRTRATPGHTAGCLTYVTGNDDIAFTGDCLLIRGAGRADFQQGDARALFHSIREQIFTLPDDCQVCPAHDYSGRTISTVAEEKQFNPRIGGDANETDFVGFMENLHLPHPKQIDIALPANMRCGRPEHEIDDEDTSWGPVVINYGGVPEISPEWTAEHRLELCILDVRKPEELSESLGKAEGAINIPLDQLKVRAEELPTDKPVVTLCRSGRRSGRATAMLRDAGIKRVASSSGGMLRWRSLGLA